MAGRGKVGDARLDKLEAAPMAAGAEGMNEILTDISRDKGAAASKILTYVKDHPDPKDLIDAARLLVFLKGTNSHDYKFSSAILEDFGHISPEWRARFLASGVFNLHGSADAENKLVKRTRAALA
jgi:hypothetical protein